MRLGALLRAAGVTDPAMPADSDGPEVAGVAHDSRQVGTGDVFCCVPGASHDGHDFAAAAVRAGVCAVVGERPLDLPVPTIVVPSVRSTMALMAAAAHGWPSHHLELVGVTGTNGKTSVVHLLTSILAIDGRRTAAHGTLSSGRTTPEAIDLQAMLGRWVLEGVETAAVEVSSHALSQYRVDGTRLALVGFTNLSRDHLDFHGSMEDYEAAKARLFDGSFADRAVVAVDGAAGSRIANRATEAGLEVTEVTQGPLEGSLRPDGVRFEWRGRSVDVATGGRFTIANALLAAELASALGVVEDRVVDGLAMATPVPGRFESVLLKGGPTLVVDYAHTPDALSGALATAREVAAGRVLVVFGCGGERDAGKRPEMGAVAETGADLVVVTSDNPRGEPPGAVIADILSGMDRVPALIESDRRQAIAGALALAEENDLVLVAGRGHEDVQESAGRLTPFDDRTVARQEWARMSSGGATG